MNIEVVSAVEPEYIRFTATGEFSLEGVYGVIERVKIEADRATRKMVLIDSRFVEGQMSDADRFFAGVRIAEIFGSRLKTAIIMPRDRITKLGESVAVSRGARLLVTESEEEALGWLLSDD